MLDTTDKPFTGDTIPKEDWCSLIFVRVYPNGSISEEGVPTKDPIGVVAVIQPDRVGALYKLPGGHGLRTETPRETAQREMRGETGIIVSLERFTFQTSMWRRGHNGHYSMLFTADIEESERDWMNSNDSQNEGEEPKFFPTDEFLKLLREGKFLQAHYDRLEEAELFYR